jgi:hypothetical protein
MCIECGCGINSVGSAVGMTAVSINDQSKQGDVAVTLGMTSSYEGMREFGSGN